MQIRYACIAEQSGKMQVNFPFPTPAMSNDCNIWSSPNIEDGSQAKACGRRILLPGGELQGT